MGAAPRPRRANWGTSGTGTCLISQIGMTGSTAPDCPAEQTDAEFTLA
jgi:hypothetical protein